MLKRQRIGGPFANRRDAAGSAGISKQLEHLWMPGQAATSGLQQQQQHASGVFDCESRNRVPPTQSWNMDVQSWGNNQAADSPHTLLHQPRETPEADWFGDGFELRQNVPSDGSASCFDMTSTAVFIPKQFAGSPAVRKVAADYFA